MRHLFINPNKTLSIALEEQTTGVKQDEIEDVYYARIVDASQLEKAQSKIEQKQSNVRGKLKGSQIRVRMATEGGETKYILTGKKPKADHPQALDEVSSEVGADMFDIFLAVSGEYQHKTRYVFPIEGTELKWEVDVFFNSKGEVCGWCKIDLENPPESTPEFPIELSDVIFSKTRKYTPKEQSIIDDLYHNQWSIKA